MSAYILPEVNSHQDLSKHLPITSTDRLSRTIVIDRIASNDIHELSAIRDMLNEEIQQGTYPQNRVLNLEQFQAYFCSHHAFVARLCDKPVAAFYVKPNFPGRCSHICNGGFLVHQDFRGNGIGYLLARAFEILAPACGFQAAFFNLVFEDNPGSIRLWRSMNYIETGRVPEAKLGRDGIPIDALMFYKKFQQN